MLLSYSASIRPCKSWPTHVCHEQRRSSPRGLPRSLLAGRGGPRAPKHIRKTQVVVGRRPSSPAVLGCAQRALCVSLRRKLTGIPSAPCGVVQRCPSCVGVFLGTLAASPCQWREARRPSKTCWLPRSAVHALATWPCRSAPRLLQVFSVT